MRPPRPTAGTDAERMLDAMLAAYPRPAFDLNASLHLTAHSRASDLRELGWDVESVRGDHIPGTRKHHWGYRLRSLDFAATDAQGNPILFVEAAAS